MKKIAVLLSGCGVFDGSEIHEAVLTLYFLSREEAVVKCFAPNKMQLDVVDHRTQAQLLNKERNVLTESARIARGDIENITKLDMKDFDALILPGGFGAVKNLCTYAVNGASCKVDKQVKSVLLKAVKSGKVIGAICIAPVVVAKALQSSNLLPTLTIGTDEGTKLALSEMGAKPVDAGPADIVVDSKNKIISTPAYMLASSINEAACGIEKLVKEVVLLA